MSSGANHGGFVHRVRAARRAYRGPFNGADVQSVVEGQGYRSAYKRDENSFLVFVKDGALPIPVNPSWTGIWDDDPTFRCLRRDLGFSRSKLRTKLNEARNSEARG